MAPKGRFAWLRSHLKKESCLSVPDGNVQTGATVSLTRYHQGNNQLWYEDLAYNVLRIKADEDLVLEERADGTLILNNFDPENAQQKWTVERDRICRKQDPSRVVTVLDLDVIFWEFILGLTVSEYDNKKQQKFHDIHLEATYFTISSTESGNVLTTASKGNPVGAILIAADSVKRNDLSQQWYQDKCGVIRACSTGYTIEALENGDFVLADYPVGVFDARWVTGTKDGSYTIIDRHDSKLCLAVSDDGKNGTLVKKETFNDNPAQTWNFNPVN